ncbi:MAG: hypothetical protein M3Y85_00435 [Bacteroidota bacterium]|nr:hypothetical protein [Bacteroidota bacterium]
MAKLERYSSFEEMDEAQKRDNRMSGPASAKKKKSSKETPGQRLFREFGELLRKGKVSPSAKKK